MKTLTEGIHSGVNIDDYVRDPAPEPSLSTRTACALLEQCPARAWFDHPRLNPDWQAGEDTNETDLGRIAHDIFLEGNRSRLVIVEADNWRTKAAQEQRDNARAQGRIPLLARKLPEIDAMVKAAMDAFSRASDEIGLMASYDIEQTMIWQDGDVWCRSRPDMLAKDYKLAIDYKTTGVSAEPNAFTKQVISLGYHLQAGLIRAGTFVLRGLTPDVIFMVQETEPPYLCSFVGLDPEFAAFADHLFEIAIGRWRNCIKTGKWLGYPQRVAWVNPPAWAAARIDLPEFAP